MKNPSALPVYVQLSEMLIREINAGRLLDGERLPPERQMAREMGTSVGTLRKALEDLQRKGLLLRRQGSGNYVRALTDSKSLYSFFRIELIQGGGLPTARVLTLDRMEKPDDLPKFGTSSAAFRIRRLRSLNADPVVLEEIWLDGSHAGRIDVTDLSESLYLYYKTRLGLWIARAEDRIGLDACPDWSPEDFTPRPGQPCGYVERIGWSQDNQSVEFSRSWFDTAKARYVARMK